MSKVLKRDEQVATKTIKVKSIDQFIKRKPKENEKNATKQLKSQTTSLNEQIANLTNEVAQLEANKQKLIQETEAEISSLKEAWAEEKQIYIDEAQKEGYEAGFIKGEQASLTEYAHLIDEANQTIQLAQEDYEITIKESEPIIIKLAVQIAEKIIHKQLDIDEDVVKRIVSDVINDLTEQEEIKIIVSPKDYEHLLHQKKDFENILQKSSKLSIYVNDELECGMCKIEYPSGKTDASIQTQLQLIEDELLNIVMEKNE
ncbi:MAG TPA: flagellar assembly protein FliH [Bacillota bacterium]|nr:flagellar assembly protein FliH [Bacillota bacterium]